MMRRATLACLLGLAFAAACVPRAAMMASLQHVSGDVVPCPAIQLEISEYVEGEAGGPPSTWTASGCGRSWRCVMKVGSASTGPFVVERCIEPAKR